MELGNLGNYFIGRGCWTSEVVSLHPLMHNDGQGQECATTTWVWARIGCVGYVIRREEAR